jgi:hypothetical protein
VIEHGNFCVLLVVEFAVDKYFHPSETQGTQGVRGLASEFFTSHNPNLNRNPNFLKSEED